MFSSKTSSVHMLDLARANAWPHLSARTSQEVAELIPPPVPCSFCNRKLHQTTAHCLTSGACYSYAFQSHLIRRHDEIVSEFVRFLCSRTLYKIVFKETIIDPSIFKAGATLKHTKPDIVAQDIDTGDTVAFDVTVVMPSRMAHAFSDKTTRYQPLCEMAEEYCSTHTSPPAGFVSMPTYLLLAVWSL